MEKENNQLALLVDKKSSKDLIQPIMNKKINRLISFYLNKDKFNYLVTANNLKEVKSNNTELNATIKAIKDFSKKLVDSESKDINTFKSNIEQYCSKIDLKRKERKEEIEVFENETKIILKKLTIDYVNEQYKVLNIRDEFKKVSFDDLIIISNINARKTLSGDIKASMTKGIKDSLNMRIQMCKSAQDKYDMRLMQLENICYKKGLETPLTINHVQGIIYEDSDSLYETKLNLLIDDELKRVENIKAQIQKKADDEAREKVNNQIKKANEIFLQPWGMIDLETLEQKKIEIENYDISIFDLCHEHAKKIQENAITFINQAVWGKKKALEDAKKVIGNMITPFEEVINDVIDSASEIFDISKDDLLKDIPESIDKDECLAANNILKQNGFIEPDREVFMKNYYNSENFKEVINLTKPNAENMSFAFNDGEKVYTGEPFVPYEKINDDDDDEKMIIAKFKIQGTTGLTNDEVLSAIRDILFNAGIFDDSLVSLEVL